MSTKEEKTTNSRMEQYSIEDLLKMNHEIPEIQRDYIWGDRKDILNRFLESLISLKNQEELNIGFLYSYQPAEEALTKYIIDGQQRFTTLFLILLYLADDKQKQEIQNLKKNFSYKVRALSDLFLNDIAYKADLKLGVGNIENATWYLEDYKTDPTAQSMLALVKWMNEEKIEKDISFENIYKKVKFWYFKVDTVGLGEELYISMNTRGVEIANYENIKVQLLEKEENEDYNKRWDVWEDFFWRFRGEDDNDIDSKMEAVLTLIFRCITNSERDLISYQKEKDPSFSLSNIELYLHILFNLEKWGFEPFIEEYFKNPTNAEYRFPMITLLHIGQLFIKEEAINSSINSINDYSCNLNENQLTELKRFFYFVENSVRRGRNSSLKNLLELLHEFDGRPFDKISVDTFDEIKENHEKILTVHELEKIRIVKESGELRKEIEKSFWDIQSQTEYILEGSLKLFFQAMEEPADIWTVKTVKEFNSVVEIFSSIFSENNTQKALSETDGINNSLITRVLLCFGDYSYNQSGHKWCFGHGDKWNKILTTESGINVIVSFLKKLYKIKQDKNTDYFEIMNEMITDFVKDNEAKEKDWRYYFVKYPRMTQPAHWGNGTGENLYVWFSDFNIRLLNKSMMSGYHLDPYLWTLYNLTGNEVITESYSLGYDAKKSIINSNKLQLLIADELNTYIIRTNKDLSKMKLPKEYRERLLVENSDQYDYFFQFEKTDDFIEKGASFVTEMALLDVGDLKDKD